MLSPAYPVRTICRVLGFAASSYYYQAQPNDDSALRAALLRLAEAWPTYGRPRLTAMLRREGWQVNHKQVGRLMQTLGLTAQPSPRKLRTTNSQHSFLRYPNLVRQLTVTLPDQVWVADITYIKLGQGFIYLAVLMDVCTRSIRGWHLSRQLDSTLTLTALRQALQTHKPTIHHSDQGVQYACHAYAAVLQTHTVQVSMATVGEPTENGYAERLMRTIKEDHVALTEYQDFTDAYRQISHFLNEVYQHQRIHSALGYLTPAEFERQLSSQSP